MKMYTFGANTMRGIEDFVNKEGIEKDNIVGVFQSNDGDYILLYYAE